MCLGNGRRGGRFLQGHATVRPLHPDTDRQPSGPLWENRIVHPFTRTVRHMPCRGGLSVYVHAKHFSQGCPDMIDDDNQERSDEGSSRGGSDRAQEEQSDREARKDERARSDGKGDKVDRQDNDTASDGNDAEKEDSDKKEDDESDDKKKPKNKKRFWTIVIVVVLVVLAIAAGIWYYLYSRQFVSTDDAFIDGQIVRVSAQETGRLTAVTVTSNARVKAGDLLASIDPAAAVAGLDVAKAQLAEAKAAVGTSQANIVEANATAKGAESALKSARVTAQNSRTKANRYADITQASGQAAISAQTLDDQLAQAQEDEAAEAQAQASLAQAHSQVVAAQAKLTSSQAQVQAAQATVEQNQVQVGYLTITAPIAGQVVQLNANIGTYVAQGTQILAIVPNDLYVTANYKETQLSRIRIGQKVDLHVDAFPGVDFKGTVQSIQRGAGQAFQLLPAQNATGNFVKVVQRVPVRISIDKPSVLDYPIGPGMSVQPSILVDN